MAIICAAAMLFTMGCGNKGVSDYTTDDTVSNALSGENTVALVDSKKTGVKMGYNQTGHL